MLPENKLQKCEIFSISEFRISEFPPPSPCIDCSCDRPTSVSSVIYTSPTPEASPFVSCLPELSELSVENAISSLDNLCDSDDDRSNSGLSSLPEYWRVSPGSSSPFSSCTVDDSVGKRSILRRTLVQHQSLFEQFLIDNQSFWDLSSV